MSANQFCRLCFGKQNISDGHNKKIESRRLHFFFSPFVSLSHKGRTKGCKHAEHPPTHTHTQCGCLLTVGVSCLFAVVARCRLACLCLCLCLCCVSLSSCVYLSPFLKQTVVPMLWQIEERDAVTRGKISSLHIPP